MPQDDIISLHNHPKWQNRNAAAHDKTPSFAQGVVTAIKTTQRPHHKEITLQLTDDSTYTAQTTPNTPQESGDAITRATQFDHEVRLTLAPTKNGPPNIVNATDITETMLINGPFGNDRVEKLKQQGDESVQSFLTTAGKPYRLSRAHVAKLWTWPVADFPELPDALNAFATIPPKHIGTSKVERTGMSGAILLGMAEEAYGKPGSIARRLNSAQGRWDKIGTMLTEDGPNQLFETIHHHLPAITAMAAGAAGAQENDLTLPTHHQSVWENIGPTTVGRFTSGSMQDVLARTKILNAIMTETDINLGAPEQAAKKGWANPAQSNALIETISQNVFHLSLDKQEASALFLGEMMPGQKDVDRTR